MPTNRSPKGNYVRSTGDFYVSQSATVGGVYWPSATLVTVLDLYNNAADGSNLHVYRVFVGNDAAGWFGMGRLAGHGANFLTNAYPVVITGPTLPGQLYQDTIAPQYVTEPFPKDQALFDAFIGDSEAGEEVRWSAPGPLCVIPPGFSMRVYPFVGSNQVGGGGMMSCTFYYVVLKDRG